MTYPEAMKAAKDTLQPVVRSIYWKPGNKVVYNPGGGGLKAEGDSYVFTASAKPRYELITGNKVSKFKPTMMDIVATDWKVLNSPTKGGSSNDGKRK